MWRLAGPIILANLSVPLLGAVDTAVMGHLAEPYYLGAIAIGALIFSYLYWGFGFLRMGTTALTAQALGAGDRAEVGSSLGRAVLSAAALGVMVVVLRPFIGLAVFGFIDASPDVELNARAYFEIRIWSAPAALINFAVLGWLLGTRRAGTALALQIFMNGLNIALDLWFVVGLGWGVEGVAWATVISEVSAGFFGLLLTARRLSGLAIPLNQIKSWGGRIFQAAEIKRLFVVNRDIFIRTFCVVSAFAIFTAQAAKMGDLVLAANAILLTLQMFLAYGLDGFAHAAEALIGGAKGARDRSALRDTVKVTTLWAGVAALIYSLVYGLFGSELIALMTTIDVVRSEAGVYLPWLIASPIISIWCYQLDGIFIGATQTGDMRDAMLLSFAAYLAAVYFLPPVIGNHGLWAALMVFMIARAITLAARYPKLEAAAAPGT